jgi:hypothetical protein
VCEQGGDVIVRASDQDGMLRLYTETLDLEQPADLRSAPPTAGSRSRHPAPKQRSRYSPAGPGVTPGDNESGIPPQTDDLDAYNARLKDRGADVDPEGSRLGQGMPPLFWSAPRGDKLMVVQDGDLCTRVGER